jgi:hypothetical protein
VAPIEIDGAGLDAALGVTLANDGSRHRVRVISAEAAAARY